MNNFRKKHGRGEGRKGRWCNLRNFWAWTFWTRSVFGVSSVSSIYSGLKDRKYFFKSAWGSAVFLMIDPTFINFSLIWLILQAPFKRGHYCHCVQSPFSWEYLRSQYQQVKRENFARSWLCTNALGSGVYLVRLVRSSAGHKERARTPLKGALRDAVIWDPFHLSLDWDWFPPSTNLQHFSSPQHTIEKLPFFWQKYNSSKTST